MKNVLKRIFSMLIAVICCVPLLLFGACEGGENGNVDKVQAFYDKVVESQQCLDSVADDIYSYWYDAIYKDKYNGDINTAILYAQLDNSENLAKIEENESEIQSLYKEVRDSDFSTEIKAVMSAYSDYYEFVVNVSGSFKSYSADKETLKKELASALKDLALEI